MSQVQVDQKTYQMPPRDGISIAHFLTVTDIERSARFYEKVFGGRVLSRGDSKGAPGYIQIANTWLIVNVGGGPTPDKPTVTLSVPPNPDSLSSFMNIRVKIFRRAMNYGEVGEPSLSLSRRRSTARRAATFAIPMGI
jgi:catechol 2,3-dioxygenase-like lactoylglutathione lyase family enzyme